MLWEILDGKKTYIGIITTILAMVTGINLDGGDVTIVMDQLQVIIAAIGVIVGIVGRYVARPE